MLAYVFSHRPAQAVDAAAYEDTLRRFHAALASSPPNGFIASETFRVGDGYSDWYLVENTAALDELNAAAVSGSRAAVHDVAAHMARDGAGKLYTLVAGAPPAGPGFEVRFAKPKGMSYPDLYRRLEGWTAAPGVSLWRRMMVLGPPPEFCLISVVRVELPAEMDPENLARFPI
jgi:hypothetical protein